jgi:hypothetical protein
MKLSDVMSAANGLSDYAEIALVVFIAVFVTVVLDLARAGRRYDGARLLPLSDETEPASSSRKGGGRK